MIYTLMQLALAVGGILLVLVAVQNKALLEKSERLEKDNAALTDALNATTAELGQVRDERDAIKAEHDSLLETAVEMQLELDGYHEEDLEREAEQGWLVN